MKKLKAAVIGTGMIANAAHIPALKNLDQQVQIVAVCGRTLDSARKTAGQWDIPGVYTDPEQMLTQCRPDLVTICTPNVSHTALAILALEHGAHVVCEKPLAITLADAKAMFAAAKKAGSILTACQSMRFRPEYQWAKAAADQDMLGDILYCEANRIRRRGVPQWGSFHRKDLNGGGAMCDLGVHILDALFWILGNRVQVRGVTGITSSAITLSGAVSGSMAESGAIAGAAGDFRTPDHRQFDVEDFAAGTIRLDRGTVNFKVSWAANLPDETSIRLMGHRGGLYLPELTLYTTLAGQQADIQVKPPVQERCADTPFYEHHLLMENVVNAIQGREELLVKPEETLRIAAILDAFYRSAELGREVTLEELD